MLNEQYHHVGANTQEEAKTVLQNLTSDERRVAIGIYDSKTELFSWEPTRQQHYNQASIGEQGYYDNHIVNIVQALRRRDSSWQPSVGFQKPSLFA